MKFREKFVESRRKLQKFRDSSSEIVKKMNHQNSWRNFAELMRVERCKGIPKDAHVNLIDLVKRFPTSIDLQKSASIQPSTTFDIDEPAKSAKRWTVRSIERSTERRCRCSSGPNSVSWWTRPSSSCASGQCPSCTGPVSTLALTSSESPKMIDWLTLCWT